VSIEILNEVWNHSKAAGTDRLVLLALADQANPVTRECWPSIGYIAHRCNVSNRTVQRSIRSLEALGEVVVVLSSKGWDGGGLKRTNRYRIVVFLPVEGEKNGCQSDTHDNVTPTDPPSDCQGTYDTGDGGPTTQVSPKPLLNRQGTSLATDELKLAVARECGMDLEKGTKSSTATLRKAAKELADAGATPEDIAPAVVRYREKFPSAAVTPLALVKWWPAVANQLRAEGLPRQPEWQRLGRLAALHVTDEDEARAELADQLGSEDLEHALEEWRRQLQPAVAG
jgi:hypothetical protein